MSHFYPLKTNMPMHSLPQRRDAVVLLSVGLLSPTLLLQGCDNIPSTIKIGVAQPLTGNLAALGQDLLNGVHLAVEELNKEVFKIKGKPVTIEVIAVDDRADAKTGKEVAQQLVDAGVVAVIGHLNSGVSIAAAPIYAEKHIAQLAISTNPKFTQLGYDSVFRLVANDDLQAKAIGSFSVTQLDAKQYAILDDGTPYGKDLAAGAAAELKKEKKSVAVQQSFDEKTTQFKALADALKAASVDVIITTMSDFQVVALIDALKQIDYTQIQLLGSDTNKTSLMLKSVGVLKGLYTSSPILDTKEFGATGAAFLEKYRAKFKTDPTYGGHYTYDAMQILASAIKRSESASPEKIVQALHKIDGYAPVTGSMKWNEKGELRFGVIAIYKARGPSWEQLIRSDVW
jgi:branched-chain amino acid transport system substrate-binding protein